MYVYGRMGGREVVEGEIGGMGGEGQGRERGGKLPEKVRR